MIFRFQLFPNFEGLYYKEKQVVADSSLVFHVAVLFFSQYEFEVRFYPHTNQYIGRAKNININVDYSKTIYIFVPNQFFV